MRTIQLIILGILLFYFQVLLAIKVSFFSIIPNFLVAYIIYINIKIGLRSCLTISFFLGLLFDLVQPNLLGLHSLSFIIFSMIIQNFHSSINKKRFTIILLTIIFINFIYYSIFAFYHFVSMQELPNFFQFFVFSVSYNSFISVITIYVFASMSKLKLTISS